MAPQIERVRGEPRWQTPGPQPNGLQATDAGLWVIDQDDLDVYLLDWRDGHVLRQFPTETHHSSGITFDGEALWVASTFTPIELFRYAVDGIELTRLPTPGAGKSGAHGLEWIDGKLWVTVPPSATTYATRPGDRRDSPAIPRSRQPPARPRLGWRPPLGGGDDRPHDHRLHAGWRRAPRPRDGARPRRRPRSARPHLSRRRALVLRCPDAPRRRHRPHNGA